MIRISYRALLGRCLAIAVIVAVVPAPAAAYVGPGAGLSALGSLLALIAAVFVAIIGFIWYPVKRLLGKRRAPTAPSGSDASPTPAGSSSDERRDDHATR